MRFLASAVINKFKAYPSLSVLSLQRSFIVMHFCDAARAGSAVLHKIPNNTSHTNVFISSPTLRNAGIEKSWCPFKLMRKIPASPRFNT